MGKMKWGTALAIAAVLAIAPTAPVSAIQGGEVAVGDVRIAALLLNQISVSPACSVTYVTSWVVATAAHCVTAKNNPDGPLAYPASNYWVSGPGEDLGARNFESRIRVSEIFRTPGYVNIWKPESGDVRTQKDDIAFLVLENPSKIIFQRQVATVDEVVELKRTSGLITHIGYGMQTASQLDGKPYRTSLFAHYLGSARYSNNPALETHTLTTNETGARALCPGDSGSPWYSTIGNVEKLVAVTVGGSGCGGSGVNGALGTVVGQYTGLLNSALAKASELNQAWLNLNKPVVKKKTIICVKGKTQKKVTGVSPKCPSGYKKK